MKRLHPGVRCVAHRMACSDPPVAQDIVPGLPKAGQHDPSTPQTGAWALSAPSPITHTTVLTA
jgi:hypothetical protein